jgi:hypothetical protein
MARATDHYPQHRVFAPPLGPKTLHVALLGIGVTFCGLTGYVVVVGGAVDWLLVSGAITLFVGIRFTQTVPAHLEHALRRLIDREVLVLAEGDSLQRLAADVETRVFRFAAPGCGIIIAVAIAVGYLVAFPLHQLASRALLIIASVIGGYIAGCYLDTHKNLPALIGL